MNEKPAPAPRYGFWPYVLPLLAFMLLGTLEPKFTGALDPAESGAASQADDGASGVARAEVTRYLTVYGVKILITSALLGFFCSTYRHAFPVRMGWLAVGVGVVGCALWIALAALEIETQVLTWLGADANWVARSQFNPLESLPQRWQLFAFLAMRFFGLAVVVPICEELFLRGFLMRVVQAPEWWAVDLSRMGIRALMVAPLYGALTHPGEILAAIAWFSLVNWLMKKTGNFWDCVLAHAVTNALLGAYILLLGQWQLW